MDMTLLGLLTSTASGLLAGALLTEALVLVPYWKQMDPEDFLRLHSTLAPLLFRFYAPVTIAGTALPLVACVIQWVFDGTATWLWSVSAICGAALIGFYFGFFRQANSQFADGESPEQLSVLLTTWATIHSIRTIIAITGFVFAGAALTT